MKFSKRSEWPTSSSPYSEVLAQKKSSGACIFDLTESNPTHSSFDYARDLLFQNLNHTDNARYEPDPRGMAVAREAVVRYYAEKNISVCPEQIFLTSGTSEAYTFLFKLLSDYGDVVLAPAPGYPLFDCLSQLCDVTLKKYSLCYDSLWSLDRESLQALAASSPKALLWVNPNNPTGNFSSEEEFLALNEFSVKNSCPLIIDEVFFDYVHGGSFRPKSFAGNPSTLTFTLSGISKVLGLPQMKLSWMVVSGPPDVCEEACRRMEIIADAYLSVNTPVQNMLAPWLKNRERVVSEILSRVRQNYTHLAEAACAYPQIKIMNTEGGWYAVIYSDRITDDEGFCLELLKKDNVVAHPGYFFDFPSEGYVVLSLLPEPETFQEGSRRLLTRLAQTVLSTRQQKVCNTDL